MISLAIVKQFFPKVSKVVDARADIQIEVTKQDCMSKAVLNHRECAMAVACKRSLQVEGAIISRSTAYLIKRDRARRYRIPGSVGREVTSFDRGGGFSPGTYSLKAVSKSQRFGAKKRSGKSGKNTGQGDKRFRHITDRIRPVLGGEE